MAKRSNGHATFEELILKRLDSMGQRLDSMGQQLVEVTQQLAETHLVMRQGFALVNDRLDRVIENT